MGALINCCGKPEDDEPAPEYTDRERLRELQAQAAEKRMKENESKGIKNLEHVKQQQAKKEAHEKMESYQGSNSGNLRWQVS